MKAIILKITANQIIVWYNNQQHQVFAPGKWKENNLILRPGDQVILEYKNKELQIVDFVQRKNVLDKPKVANIDNLIIVQSYVQPNLNWTQLLKTIAFYEYQLNLIPVLVITKTDLQPLSDKDKSYLNDLKKQDYLIFIKNDLKNLNEFQTILKNKISSFVGQSGVGKSTLINDLDNSLKRVTNDISIKLKRGKNTTTQSELLFFLNGFLVDTPGYSKFQTNLSEQELSVSFHLFAKLKLNCKFKDCIHLNENNCAVKNAIENKILPSWQYEIYLKLQKQLKKYDFFY